MRTNNQNLGSISLFKNPTSQQWYTQSRYDSVLDLCTLRLITLLQTSLAFDGATSVSSTEKGFFCSHSTAALHLIT